MASMDSAVASPVGVGVALVLPMYLSAVRDLVPHAALAVVLLVLVAVVGSIAGRGSAFMTSGVGTLSFDAFVIESHGVLRPDRLAFWTTAGVLLLVACATPRTRD